MTTGKTLLAAGAMLLAIAYVAVPHVAGAADSTVYVGRGSGQPAMRLAGTPTDGGLVPTMTHGSMKFSDQCVEVTATQSADGGTAVLTPVPGQWFDTLTTGDGTGGVAGCWQNGSQPTTCVGKPRLKDQERRAMDFPVSYPGVDAGAANGKAVLYFLSSTATTMTFLACPESP